MRRGSVSFNGVLEMESEIDSFVNPTNDAYQQLGCYEMVWLVACTLIAATIGIARAIRDDDYSRISDLLALGVCFGGAGLVCVGFAGYANGGIAGTELLLLALAGGSALIGKPVELAIRSKVTRFLRGNDRQDSGS